MIVKNSIKIVLLGGTLLLGGCASGYLVKDIEGGRVAMTAEYDKNPDRDAEAILQPYRRVVDSIMSPVVGHSARALEAYRPESPLSNLLAAYFVTILYKLAYFYTPDTIVFDLLLSFLRILILINVNLAVFNLLPIPPFDGSRIATVFLPRKLYFQIMQYERYIFIGMFLLLMLGVFDVPLSLMNNWMLNLLNQGTAFVDHMVYGAAGLAV